MATTPKPSILKNSGAKIGGPSAGTEAASSTPAEMSGSKSGGLLRWLLIGGGALLLLAGFAAGGLWWKRHHSHGKTSAAPAKAAVVKEIKPAAPPTTVEMSMDPFVVNLADAGGHSYARIGLTLVLLAPAEAKKSDKKSEVADAGPDLKAEARDAIITLLSEQQAADLLAAGGKEHLKQLMRQALVARDPRLQVTDIYFTEFLVQS